MRPHVARRSRVALAVAATVATLLPLSPPAAAPARADTHTWVGPSGGFWTTGTWSPAGAPTAGDSAWISVAPAAAYSVTYNGNYTAGAGALAAVTLDSSSSYNLTLIQNSASYSLHAGYVYVGDTGRATYAHSAGTHALSGYLALGISAGSTGTYSLSGTGSLAAASTVVGNGGAGTFRHSAGTHAVSSTLYLGTYAGSTGTYSLSGTGSLAAGSAYVGVDGAGTFAHSAGTHAVSGSLNVGNAPGSTGTYSLSGTGSLAAGYAYVGRNGNGTFVHSAGTHSASGELALGTYAGSTGTYSLSGTGSLSAGYAYVGSSGVGTFAHSAGTNTVATSLSVGYIAGSTGTYSLSGTGARVVSGYSYAGYSGAGTFLHSAGSHSASTLLSVGFAAGSTGTYSLSGTGSLSAGSAYVGYSGAGTFLHSAGSHAVSYSLCLGVSAGSTGTYSLSGTGSLSIGSTAYVGGDGSAPGGAGLLSVSGGTASVPYTLRVYDTPGTALALSGGTLAVGSLDLSGNPALLSWTGGTLRFSNGYTINPSFVLGPAVTLAPTLTLATGATATNAGSITLAGGALAGTGSLTNAAAGLIAGRGTISTAAFANAGTLLLDSSLLAVSPNFTNSGLVQLAAPTANLSGGAITNTGTIQGLGKIASPVSNSGTIEAVGNGTLVLAGALTNAATGTLRVPAGHKLLVTGAYPMSAGLISLTGGTFDTNNQPLSNAGHITGFGTLATGGAGLTNNGTVTLTGGLSTVHGPVTNNATRHIKVLYNPAIFTAPVANAGTITVTNTTATFAAGLSGTAPAEPTGPAADPAAAPAALTGSLTVAPAAAVTTPLLHQSSLTNSGAVDLLPSSQGGQPAFLATLSLLPGSSFDLADNDLTLTSTPADTVRSYLCDYRLTSSAPDPQDLLSLAYQQRPADVLVTLAYTGDANLDGRVDADDYLLTDRGLALSLPSPHWRDGDFDHSGTVNASDYLLIDRTFVLQGAPLSPDFLADREARFGEDYVAALVASVPEPGLLGPAGLGLLLAGRRRRRS